MIYKSAFIGSIVIFLLLLVPYFQNISEGIKMKFFGAYLAYHTAFWFLIIGAMVLGALIILLIQGFIQNIKENTDKNKFEM